jgi:hypothetical protein
MEHGAVRLPDGVTLDSVAMEGPSADEAAAWRVGCAAHSKRLAALALLAQCEA